MLRLVHRFLLTPSFNFCDSRDMINRQLTSAINSAQSADRLIKIMKSNSEAMNIIHISAVFKKLNVKMIRDKQILETVFQSAKKCLQKNYEPNPDNARALANIVGYSGNIDYCSQYLKNINYKKLCIFLKQKQFVMLLTGLLKLNIIDETIGDEHLERVVGKFIKDCSKMGLLVSLWRNLLKSGKCSESINNQLVNRITVCRSTANLKDLGYLVYCYTSSPFIKEQNSKLSEFIIQCFEGVLYTTRINVFELCIFLDHLAQLKKYVQSPPNQQFIFVLRNQYIRIMKNITDLRSLANGYMSMVNFKHALDEEIFQITIRQFLNYITTHFHSITDFQSVTSLFLQIITTKPVQHKSFCHVLPLLQQIKALFFHPSTKKIFDLTEKELQKLLYTFYLCKKQGIGINFSEHEISLLLHSLLRRESLTQIQKDSIIASIVYLIGRKEQNGLQDLKNIRKDDKND